jgi:hypothetical protein
MGDDAQNMPRSSFLRAILATGRSLNEQRARNAALTLLEGLRAIRVEKQIISSADLDQPRER